ncbi:hypothetical protein KR009_000325 [Drosophila setifemur]|nr:hypothetical protein KR009_000325 [Drosophila setifemur]
MNNAHRNQSLQLLLLLSLGISCCCGLLNATSCGHRCGSGECIHLDELCDGKAHCLDASDETSAMCAKVWCPGYSFRCSYGACVASTAVCDGMRDCVDGSDELRWLCRAQMQQANCDNWEMYCSSGQCVPYSKLCDGVKDCLDGDDELESLCEGAVLPTTKRSPTMTSQSSLIEMTSTSAPSRRDSIQEDDGCVVPQLPNVIVKHFSHSVIQPGTRVPNGTFIFYDCPADHSLKGEHENLCNGSMWTQTFPYCETPTAFVFSLVISLFAFLMVILVFLIWRVRRESGLRRQREEHIWLVETRSNPPQQSDVPKV